MSKQALEAFSAKLVGDEGFRSEMTRFLSQDGKKTSASADDLVAFAASRGYDISPEEVRGTMELGDEELGAVAGGLIGPMDLKVASIGGSYSIESFSFNFQKVSY